MTKKPWTMSVDYSDRGGAPVFVRIERRRAKIENLDEGGSADSSPCTEIGFSIQLARKEKPVANLTFEDHDAIAIAAWLVVASGEHPLDRSVEKLFRSRVEEARNACLEKVPFNQQDFGDKETIVSAPERSSLKGKFRVLHDEIGRSVGQDYEKEEKVFSKDEEIEAEYVPGCSAYCLNVPSRNVSIQVDDVLPLDECATRCLVLAGAERMREYLEEVRKVITPGKDYDHGFFQREASRLP